MLDIHLFAVPNSYTLEEDLIRPEIYTTVVELLDSLVYRLLNRRSNTLRTL